MTNITKLNIFLVFLFIANICNAQQQDYTLEVKPVETAGYYQIKLTPELLGTAKLNLSDVRLIDENNFEIPYYLEKGNYHSSSLKFEAYPIVEQQSQPNGYSYIVFKNQTGKKINEIGLEIKNAQTNKQAQISGSYDKKEWFTVKENHTLRGVRNNTESSDIVLINFPISDYPYFKITVNDTNSLPLNIIRVGKYNYQITDHQTTKFQSPIKQRIDSSGFTVLKIKHPSPIYFEKFSVYSSGTNFYHRNIKARNTKKKKIAKKKWFNYYQTFTNGVLASNRSNQFNTGKKQIQNWELVIDNNDNPPLIIDSICASFANRYLIASLVPGKNYQVVWGNKKLKRPIYDINHFRDSIQTIGTLTLHQLGTNKAIREKTEANSFWDEKTVLWCIIILVGLFILLISIKITTEMKE